jgi:hypothetical protein
MRRADGLGHEDHKAHDDHKGDGFLVIFVIVVAFVVATVGTPQCRYYVRS